MSDLLPIGYVPGVSSQQAADRPLSRADQPRTPKQIRDMIETKKVLRKSIQSASDPEYFARNEKRWLDEIATLQLKLEGLRLNRDNADKRIAKVDGEIEKLEVDLKLAENAAKVESTKNMLQSLAEAGIDLSLLLQL